MRDVLYAAIGGFLVASGLTALAEAEYVAGICGLVIGTALVASSVLQVER